MHLGRFIISRTAIEEYPDEIMRLMGKMIVLYASRCEWFDFYEYRAISAELFEYLENPEIIPEYDILFTDDGILARKI